MISNPGEAPGRTTTHGRVVLGEGGDSIGGALVRLALSVKRIPWDHAPVARRRKRDDAERPGLRVRIGDVTLEGVLAVLEGLEETFDQVPLLPREMGARAQVRRVLELGLPAMEAEKSGDALEAAMVAIEADIADHDGEDNTYAVCGVMTLADLVVLACVRAARDAARDLAPYPTMHRIFAGIRGMPAIESAYRRRDLRGTRGLAGDLGGKWRERYLDRVLDVVGPIAGKVRLLEAMAWPRDVEEAFFASGASRLPSVSYDVDRVAAETAIGTLASLLGELGGEHLILEWLRNLVQSFIDAQRMMLALGTPQFYSLSLELYGGARSSAFDRDTTNLDLAHHVEQRVGSEASFVETDALDTGAFVAFIEAKLAARTPRLDLAIVRDPKLGSKVICGRTRLRVREGATFGHAEAEGLWLHEVETHALTAQNGAAQKGFPLLKSGGPRATRTQEGLAVFSELYGHALSTPRLMRLAQRVRLVAMAESGASFIDLHRDLVSRGLPPRDAYPDAARICRGGVVAGGAPFTKDASYLAGLVDVYNFLRRGLRFRSPILGELLVTGRFALDDIGALLWLRGAGVLEAPVFKPQWVEAWDSLLSYFAFSSFLPEVDMDVAPALPDDVVELINKAVVAYDEGRTRVTE